MMWRLHNLLCIERPDDFLFQSLLQHLGDVVKFIRTGLAEGGTIYLYDDASGGGWAACVAMAVLLETRGMTVLQAFLYVRERLPAVDLSTTMINLVCAFRQVYSIVGCK
jgi:hypothetical protein